MAACPASLISQLHPLTCDSVFLVIENSLNLCDTWVWGCVTYVTAGSVHLMAAIVLRLLTSHGFR